MSPDGPVPAAWIDGLPRDSRGFVVPAEAGWQVGKPILAKVDQDRKVALGMQRACAVCGYEMPKGTKVYRAFAQLDAAQIRGYQRDLAHEHSGPVHLSCILYSTMVCPYLRERTSRLAKDNDFNPGGRRGTRAAVMGFDNYGLMIPIWQGPRRSNPGTHFAYLKLVDDIGYRDGAELTNRYIAAVRSDAEIIDTTRNRLFWTDADQDQQRLSRALNAVRSKIAHTEPSSTQEIEGMGRFGVIEL
jgi:hypothetical protein